MKKALLLSSVLLFAQILTAQYANVNLDFDKSYIGENELLPAESNLLFSGTIPAYIDQVEIRIYDSKGHKDKDPIHVASWKRPLENTSSSYALPVNFKLRSGNYYDIEILYFQPIDLTERDALLARLYEEATLFLDSQRSKNGEWDKNPERLIRKLQDLLDDELSIFRPSSPVAERSLSPTLALYMEKMEDTRRDSAATQRQQLEFQSLLSTEIELLVPEKLSKAVDRRFLDDMPTEKSKKGISVNVGYGGVFLDGEIDQELDYDTAPYAGLSFPLGNSAFASKFLSNTYLGFGVLFNELENAEGQTISGPIINRPIYGSLDFKLFQFVYLSVGANLLEQEFNNKSELLVRPFIGLSGKVNLALSLER
jgi:hypothetical protein